MDDVPLAAEVAVRCGRARHETDEQVILARIVADAMVPKRTLGAGMFQVEPALVDPSHALVARLGHADFGPVPPLNAGQIQPGPALCVDCSSLEANRIPSWLIYLL